MEIKLLQANINNAKEIHTMQVEAFKELLEKYQDFDINPGNESVEKNRSTFTTKFYIFLFYLYWTAKGWSYSYC